MKLANTIKIILLICCMLLIIKKEIKRNQNLKSKNGNPNMENGSPMMAMTTKRPLPNIQEEWINQLAHDVISNKTRKNNSILLCQNSKKATTTVLLIIILTCGDIELNPGPGPNQSIYPCGICERRVNWSARAIACDNCSIWFHQSCISMSDGSYDKHIINESVVWLCNHCGTPNYGGSFTYHSFEQSTNRFSILEGALNESSLRSPEINFRPKYTSSPTEKAYINGVNETADSEKDNSNPYDIKSWNNLRILTTNAQSLRRKTSLFRSVLKYCKPDVCCITETWLFGKKPGKDFDNHCLLDSELGLNEYRIFRNDRNEDGGGVAIMVKRNIIATEEHHLVSDCEINWVKIKLKKNQKDLLIGCFYMPHRNLKDIEELNRSLDTINKANHRHVILCGDFNSPGINWDSHALKQGADDKELQRKLLEVTSHHALHQVVKEPTRGQSTLDLMFTTNPSLLKTSNNIPGISDHDIVLGDFDSHPQYLKFKKRAILVYRKAKWESLKLKCNEISNRVIQNLNETNDINWSWEIFKSELNNAIKENIPTKTYTNRNSVPWMTEELKRMIRTKTKLHRKAKKSNNWTRFKLIQKECKIAFRRAERNYISQKLEEGLRNNNSKPLWKYIKSKRQDNTGVAPLLDEGKLLTSDLDIAGKLLKQFSSVFTTSSPCQPPQVNKVKVDKALTKIAIRTRGVEKLLRSIKVEKASGPDLLPNRVLKECSHELAPGLSAFFQFSLDNGTLPTDWKNANISPIFKKGDRRKAENYRPVSLTSVTSKLLEHIVYKNILDHLERNTILTSLNHGFRKGFSCETQLAITIDDLARAYDRDIQSDVAILDFSKAFDTVPHDRLLLKLQAYGIEGPLHNWVTNYLCQRKMRVIINGETSGEEEVLSGVPQGTVLGPLLFLCHINDLPLAVTSSVRLFADDCLLYRKIKTPLDHEKLQQDLNNLEAWAEKWGMNFNPSKCYILSIAPKSKSHHFYQLGNSILKEVENNPYLGVNIANDLSWDYHISKVSGKANSALGFVRRNLHQCPREAKRAAYISLVRSILEYGSIIWDPALAKDIDLLEKTQRKAARFIEGDYRSRYPGCVSNMLLKHRLPPLKERRKDLRLSFMYKIVEGHLPAIQAESYFEPIVNRRKILPKTYDDHITSNPIAKYETKNNRCFKIPTSQKPNGAYNQSYFVRTIIDWNKLSDETVTAGSIDSFRTLLAKD